MDEHAHRFGQACAHIGIYCLGSFLVIGVHAHVDDAVFFAVPFSLSNLADYTVQGSKNPACLRFKSHREAYSLLDHAFFLVEYVTK